MTNNREEYTMGYGPAAVALMGARERENTRGVFSPSPEARDEIARLRLWPRYGNAWLR